VGPRLGLRLEVPAQPPRRGVVVSSTSLSEPNQALRRYSARRCRRRFGSLLAGKRCWYYATGLEPSGLRHSSRLPYGCALPRSQSGSSVLAGGRIYPVSQARAIVRGLADMTANAPDELYLSGSIINASGEGQLPRTSNASVQSRTAKGVARLRPLASSWNLSGARWCGLGTRLMRQRCAHWSRLLPLGASQGRFRADWNCRGCWRTGLRCFLKRRRSRSAYRATSHNVYYVILQPLARIWRLSSVVSRLRIHVSPPPIAKPCPKQ
jgi:hypothetical protein